MSGGGSGSRRILAWGFLFTLLFAAIYAFMPNLFRQVDLMNYDLLLRHFPDNHESGRVVIVDLDERTLKRYGQWPWPRYRLADLLDRIAAAEPAVVALDMVFAEPDRTSARRVLDDLSAFHGREVAIGRLPVDLSDNDGVLAETLTRGPFVLGNQFHFGNSGNSSEQCVLHPLKASFLRSGGRQEENRGIPEGAGLLCSLPMFSEKAAATGFLNFSPDGDGVARRLQLLIRYRGKVYPSLALATVLKLKGTDSILLKEDGKSLQSLRFGTTSVAVDDRGQLLVRFRGPKRTHAYVSAADVMDGGVPSGKLRGKVVLVGTSAAGMAEWLATPFGPTFPGIETHAAVVDNLLTGDLVAEPGWSRGLVLLLVIIPGAALSLLFRFRGTAFCLVATALFLAALWLTMQQVFFHAGLFVGTTFPMASIVCGCAVLAALKHREEQRRAEDSLRESEARFRTLFAMAPISLANIARDGRVLEVNNSLTRVMGYTADDLPTVERVWDLCMSDPSIRDGFAAQWRAALADSTARDPATESLECPVLCKDGTSRTMVIATESVRGGVIVAFFDITERKRAEEDRQRLERQLLQARKMDAIGQLAGGVAHDFNNMLNVIIGNAEMALGKAAPGEALREELQDILTAGRRSADLTRQLLAFARKQIVSPRVLNLNDAVAGMLRMLRRLIGENINLAWRPEQGLWLVRMDPSQVDQLLANLTVNARDAMNKTGKIIIETSNAICDELFQAAHPESAPGEYVLLTVTDDGCGMDKETLANIFEPFFTTKEEGMGTGLGLSTVYGIVRQNGGFIDVYSEPGRGTTFRIYLPRYGADVRESVDDRAITKMQGGSETVLVVEDEQSVLNLTRAMLEKLGYRVLAVKGAVHALRLAREYDGDIDLLLTDVVM
ncbi:MAG TPA: CHASE2 domain-containing protein, partial [Syntrophorhabdaceae bacterium]|nr:CHASE2 domain-containing protein [Syntrophorhabdaceae bacterium]